MTMPLCTWQDPYKAWFSKFGVSDMVEEGPELRVSRALTLNPIHHSLNISV